MNITQYGIEAQRAVIKEMADEGRIEPIQWHEDFQNGKATIKEMIGTDSGSREFIEKITYDAYSGREQVPLLYKDIYSTTTDSNLPETMTVKEFGPVQIVFLQKWEGGEIKFGAMAPGPEKVVKLQTWAAGFEYNEDIIEYNKTWQVSDIGLAFGEAYNKLLNHLHLSPIIEGTYATEAGGVLAQRAKQEDPDNGAAQLIAFNTDIKTTLRDALQVLPRGSVVLHNTYDEFRIQEALAADLLADNSRGPVYKKFSNLNYIAYDGEVAQVGGKTYEYGGVPTGTIFLLVPKVQFREYIKHDLRVDSGDGDLSRLIVEQIVGRTRRGQLAGLSGAFGAVKIELED